MPASHSPNRSSYTAWVGLMAYTAITASVSSAYGGTDTAVIELPPLVSLATKTPRALSENPLPATVIGQKSLERRGMLRLGDVLGEETGVILVHDHGTGVQIQGLSPAYTLILIDGEPAVGRSAGTLELDRFVLGGLDRVEMIKGPSSSLYGSEALGGVINLVTRKPSEPFATSLRSRYATNNTLQNGATIETKGGATGLSLLVDRTSSDGYELTPETVSRTAPTYENYTVQPKLVHETTSSTFSLSPRFFHERQRNDGVYFAGPDSARDTLTGRDVSKLTDISASAQWEYKFNGGVTGTLKGYATRYRTSTMLRTDGSTFPDSTISSTAFDQRYYKAEAFTESKYETQTVLAGGGGVWESAAADRVDGGERSAQSGFLFAQHEWRPTTWATLLSSGRLDAHRDYAATLSPRLAGQVKPLHWLKLRASVGKGFKSPTFQQLYMDFTNPQVGYSVFGAVNVARAVDELEAQGQIRDRVRVLSEHQLRPEHSWSYNAGAEAELGPASARVNFFRNDVQDLIEAMPVAARTNGQSVYSYFNISRIRTWGLETESAIKPARWLTLSAGYQFLIAEDLDILDSIAKRRIYKVGSTGVVRPVQAVEYGGLFNRSRHSANVKADLETGSPGFSASVRGIYRGRYGYADDNGNGILDQDSEYIPGHVLWNLSASQKVTRFVTIDIGAENLFNHREPISIPSMPTYAPSLAGRRLYAGIRLQYF